MNSYEKRPLLSPETTLRVKTYHGQCGIPGSEKLILGNGGPIPDALMPPESCPIK